MIFAFQFELRVRKELLKQIHEAYAESEGEEIELLQLVAKCPAKACASKLRELLGEFPERFMSNVGWIAASMSPTTWPMLRDDVVAPRLEALKKGEGTSDELEPLFFRWCDAGFLHSKLKREPMFEEVSRMGAEYVHAVFGHPHRASFLGLSATPKQVLDSIAAGRMWRALRTAECFGTADSADLVRLVVDEFDQRLTPEVLAEVGTDDRKRPAQEVVTEHRQASHHVLEEMRRRKTPLSPHHP